MEDKTKPMKNGSAMSRRSVTSTAEHHPNKERDQLRRKLWQAVISGALFVCINIHTFHLRGLYAHFINFPFSSHPLSHEYYSLSLSRQEAECKKEMMDVKFLADTKMADSKRELELQKAAFNQEVNTKVCMKSILHFWMSVKWVQCDRNSSLLNYSMMLVHLSLNYQ